MLSHAYNPSPRKLSPEDCEFEVILNGVVSFKPAHASMLQSSPSQTQRNEQQQQQKPNKYLSFKL